ncbi:MAG: type VI secretion system baseplate subunit TssK [Proteobacteria bacterium]|nr:type VI secretion system baseplate subunit TssK [Pseudomonadota bacterium]
MDFTRPIYWHEGMLLRPQHFQQQDRYHETLVHHLLTRVNPFYWGVVDLGVNPDALHNMVFEVNRCTLLLGNGLMLRYPGNADVERRSFEQALPPAGKPLSVYLGVMELKPGENNAVGPYDEEGAARHRRYVVKAEGSPTYDLFAADSSGPIEFLHYDVRLFFGGEKDIASDYHLIKIAEVQRTDQGFSLSRAYIPPAAVMSGDPVLFGLLKKVRDRMTAKGRELQEFKRDRGMMTREIGPRDTLYLLYSLSLNRYIPLLHQMTAPGTGVHPLDAYRLLRAIVGELSSFSSDVSFLGARTGRDDSGLKDYDHEDLWNCFQPAADLIEALLEGLVAQGGYSVKLAWDGEFYSADLDERVLTGNNRYHLIITTTLPLNQLLAMMKDTAKICSREGIPTLITRALYGVPAEYLPAPPPRLPHRAQAHYFLLDHASHVWSRIEKDHNISISFENKKIEDISIEFAVLSEET